MDETLAGLQEQNAALAQQWMQARDAARAAGDTEAVEGFTQLLVQAGAEKGPGLAKNMYNAAFPSGVPNRAEAVPNVKMQPADLAGLINPMLSPTTRANLGYMLAPSDEARADILRAKVPGTEITADAKGRLLAKQPGEEVPRFINKPGISPIDLAKFGTQGGIGAALSAPSAGMGVVGGGLLDFLMGAGQSVGEDLMSRSQGGGNTVNPEDAGMAGLVNAAVPGVGKAVSKLAGRAGASMFDRATQTFSPKAQELLQGSGLDLSRLDPKGYETLGRLLGQGYEPKGAFRMAQAASMPVPVQLDRAQVTQDPVLAAAKERLSSSAHETVMGRMKQMREGQQGALGENIETLLREVGGGQAVDPQGHAMRAQAALVGKAQEGKAGVNQLYKVAREQTDATIPGSALEEMVGGISGSLGKSYPAEEVTKAMAALRRLQGLASDVPGTGSAGTAGGAIVDASGRPLSPAMPGKPADVAASLKDVMTLRQQVSALIPGQKTPTGFTTEGAGLLRFKGALDDELERIFASGAVEGNPAALKAWQDAGKANATFKSEFAQRDLVGSLVRKGRDGAALAVSPEDAVNKILGVSNAGFVSKPNLVADLGKMQRLLGADSAEWQGVKQALLDRALKGNIDEAMSRNPAIFSAMFNPKELQTIRQFSDVMGLSKNKIPYTGNPSGTAGAVGAMAGRAMNTGLPVYAAAKAMRTGDTGLLQDLALLLPGAKIVKGLADRRQVRTLANAVPNMRPQGAKTAQPLMTGGILGLLQGLQDDKQDPDYYLPQ